MMRNRPEFHIADIAVLLLGATPISIYNSSAPDQVQYLVGHCGGVRRDRRGHRLPRTLPQGAQRAARPAPHRRSSTTPSELAPADVHQWDALLGAAPLIDRRRARQRAARRPRHRHLHVGHDRAAEGRDARPREHGLDDVGRSARRLGVDPTGWRVVSYLPMAHIAERTSSHYLGDRRRRSRSRPVRTRARSCRTSVQTRPQFFFAVPRVWEKAHAALRGRRRGRSGQGRRSSSRRSRSAGRCRKRSAHGEALPDAFEESVGAGRARARSRARPDRARPGRDRDDRCRADPVRDPAVLPQPRRAALGGLRPVRDERPDDVDAVPRQGRHGRPADAGCRGACSPRTARCCTAAATCSAATSNAPEQTAEVLDADGWFHTGDIGVLDDDGYLKIVDRKKELIITAGGKNISPANLEAALKAGALIGQACVIGDNQPFISALLVLDPDVAPGVGHAHGIDATDLAALAAHPDVQAEVEREVDEANAALLAGRADQALDAARRRVAPRLGGAHADDEAQAPRRAPQVRRRDRRAVRLALSRRPAAYASGLRARARRGRGRGRALRRARGSAWCTSSAAPSACVG